MARQKKKNINKLFYLVIIGVSVILLSLWLNANRLVFTNKAAPIPPGCLRFPCPTKTLTTSGSTIAFMGDLSLGRYVNKKAYDDKSYDLFDTRMESFLKSNFVNVANLESSIIGRNSQGILQCPISGSGGLMILCGLPEFVPELSRNNFIFNLANNHINDFASINGKARTMTELSKYGIPYYYSHDETTEFAAKYKNGIKFGFLGFDLVGHLSFNESSLKFITDKIKKYDSRVDWLIVSVHWGQEYATDPSKSQKDYAHAFVDAGADVIHGHHPHILQPYEWYKDRIIFYSLGNFVFDQDFQESTRTSAMYRVDFTKTGIKKIDEYRISIPKDGKTKITSYENIYMAPREKDKTKSL